MSYWCLKLGKRWELLFEWSGFNNYNMIQDKISYQNYFPFFFYSAFVILWFKVARKGLSQKSEPLVAFIIISTIKLVLWWQENSKSQYYRRISLVTLKLQLQISYCCCGLSSDWRRKSTETPEALTWTFASSLSVIFSVWPLISLSRVTSCLPAWLCSRLAHRSPHRLFSPASLNLLPCQSVFFRVETFTVHSPARWPLIQPCSQLSPLWLCRSLDSPGLRLPEPSSPQ